MPVAPSEQGFTLIEALVALLVLAIAAAGLVRASEAHVDSIRAIERGTAAQLVAQNRLVEIAIGDPAASGSDVAMLGDSWQVKTIEKATADPDIKAVTIDVAGKTDAAALVSLDGFRDLGSTTR